MTPQEMEIMPRTAPCQRGSSGRWAQHPPTVKEDQMSSKPLDHKDPGRVLELEQSFEHRQAVQREQRFYLSPRARAWSDGQTPAKRARSSGENYREGRRCGSERYSCCQCRGRLCKD